MQIDLQFKKDLEQNIFDTNLFNVDVLDNNYYFDLSACKKSSKFEEDKFTNYLKNRKELYRYIKKEYHRFLKNDFDLQDGLLEEYEIKHFGGKRMRLLSKIIKDNTNKRIGKLPIIYRLCNRNNKEIQFYYYEANKNVYRIVAIDLFHLLMPANDNERSNFKNDGVNKYEENKDNDICLSEIIN